MPELHNSVLLVLLNKDKISKLVNLEILLSLKIPHHEKSARASQFDLTRVYGIIILNSVFYLRNSRSHLFFNIKHESIVF